MNDAPPLAAPAAHPLAAPAGAALASLRARLFGVRPVSKKRKAIALAVAFAADLVQIVLWPMFAEGAASPLDDALDAVVALVLCITLGLRPRLVLALAMELVPGADLFPTWTAVVTSIPVEAVTLAAARTRPSFGTPESVRDDEPT